MKKMKRRGILHVLLQHLHWSTTVNTSTFFSHKQPYCTSPFFEVSPNQLCSQLVHIFYIQIITVKGQVSCASVHVRYSTFMTVLSVFKQILTGHFPDTDLQSKLFPTCFKPVTSIMYCIDFTYLAFCYVHFAFIRKWT